jgi:Tol biopolymer transport system component
MRIPLAHDGTPSAPPQVLKDTGQIAYRHMNFSADGRVMAYSQDSTENNLWSIPISSKTYDALGPPQPLTHDTNRRKTVPKFSPDGNAISYWSEPLE